MKKPNWGGPRPGAGRPRKPRPEQLSAAECQMLAELLRGSLYAADHRETLAKLHRMAGTADDLAAQLGLPPMPYPPPAQQVES